MKNRCFGLIAAICLFTVGRDDAIAGQAVDHGSEGYLAPGSRIPGDRDRIVFVGGVGELSLQDARRKTQEHQKGAQDSCDTSAPKRV